MEKITFFDEESNESVEFYILEETTVSEHKYVLVAEDAEGDADATILRQITESDDDVIYEPVSDDTEFSAILKVFQELLEDTEFE